MTQYSIDIFSDRKLLEEKLAIYLQTPEKVSLYANACEKFFKAGNRKDLRFTPTLSFWALFFCLFALLYRKCYKTLLHIILWPLVCGLFAIILLPTSIGFYALVIFNCLLHIFFLQYISNLPYAKDLLNF